MLTRCRASVVRFGPNWRGSLNGLFGSWMFAVLSSSEALPMLLVPFDRVYDAVKSSPFDRRRRAARISALYVLSLPKLVAGRVALEFGFSVPGAMSAAIRRVVVPRIRWLTRGRKFRSRPSELMKSAEITVSLEISCDQPAFDCI